MNNARFPWSYALINGAGILVATVWNRIASSPHPNIASMDDLVAFALFTLGFGAIAALFLFLLSLAYQGVIHAIFTRAIKNKLIWLILFLLPATAIFALSIHDSLPSVQVRSLLKDGRLAALPKDTTGIRVYAWSGLFTGAQYLRFEAPQEQINEFLRNSSSLAGVQPTLYSKDFVRIPFPEKFDESPQRHNSEKYDYYHPPRDDPEWFTRELRDNGRVYEIPSEGNHNSGLVIVDDIRNIVYIYVIWS